MDRDNVRERLFKVISELQNQKIEIMQLLGKSGKSSVSCPLKPSDSAPLKHSTMPP